MTKEILNIEDVTLLVDSFYQKVRKDQLLGGIFNGVIQNRWPEHLEKMYRFGRPYCSKSIRIMEAHLHHTRISRFRRSTSTDG